MDFNKVTLESLLMNELKLQVIDQLNDELYHYSIEDFEENQIIYPIERCEITDVTNIKILNYNIFVNKNLYSIFMKVQINFIDRVYFYNDDVEEYRDINDNCIFEGGFDYNSRWHRKYKHFSLEYIK